MIVLLHPALAYGAVERYVQAIARALREETVLLHPGVEEFESLPVRSIRIEPSVVGIARFPRASRPRLVHVTDVWPQGVLAAQLGRVPRILVTHHTPELPRRDGEHRQAPRGDDEAERAARLQTRKPHPQAPAAGLGRDLLRA